MGVAIRGTAKFFALVLFLFAGICFAEAGSGVEFRADFYRRDLSTNTVKGKGNAWVKRESREVWADEIEIDLNTNRAVANGNVHLRDGKLDIWAVHASFNLKGEDALMEDARLISSQVVLTGAILRKIDSKNFEVEEGSYSNCNVDAVKDKEIADCALEWKIYGKRFRVTVGEYAHFYEVLLFAKNLPLFYTPYLVIPVKTKRQTGLLMPSFSSYGNLGTGTTLPLFLALSDWHDLTITPTQWSITGLHVGTNYRYNYDGLTSGFANVFFTSRRYSSSRSSPTTGDTNSPKLLGVFGEGAINAHNQYYFSPRGTQSRQVFRMVSNPYYTFDYFADVPLADLGYNRSEVTFTHPSDGFLYYILSQYHQSMTVSVDEGVDRGAPILLPRAGISRRTSPFLGQTVSLEVDTEIINYFRQQPYDAVPDEPNANVGADNLKAGQTFGGNDYLRTGRRLQVEPRLIANIPMPPGFQFQPVFTAGSLVYQFDYPVSSVVHREYAAVETPLSLYMGRSFETGIAGYEKISHVFQPRVLYASSLYQSDIPTHPFFYARNTKINNTPLANPRFDLIDQVTPYEYLRFELINRLRRKSKQLVERFWLLQVSEQYNVQTSNLDPRFQNRIGPLEILNGLTFGHFSLQLQGLYQLQPTTILNNEPLAQPVHESSWSSTLAYDNPMQDSLKLTTLFTQTADPAAVQQYASLYFYKTLPTFLNLDGQIEYSMRTGTLLGYRLGFYFRAKPRSCWRFAVSLGRTAFKQPFANFSFQLDFGNPTG